VIDVRYIDKVTNSQKEKKGKNYLKLVVMVAELSDETADEMRIRKYRQVRTHDTQPSSRKRETEGFGESDHPLFELIAFWTTNPQSITMSTTIEAKIEHQMRQFGRLLTQCLVRVSVINFVYLFELASIAVLLFERYVETFKKTVQATLFVFTRHLDVILQNVNLFKFAATNFLLILFRPNYIVPDLPEPPQFNASNSCVLFSALRRPNRTANPNNHGFEAESTLD
jgi:hypothetical protein